MRDFRWCRCIGIPINKVIESKISSKQNNSDNRKKVCKGRYSKKKHWGLGKLMRETDTNCVNSSKSLKRNKKG